MNVHPGGTGATTREAIRSTVLPLRERLGCRGPFGLAVRWSAAGVDALHDDPDEAALLRDLLREHDLHVFTGNAFVHGTFHGRPLKEAVYRPAWDDPERLRYTLRFAEVLASLAAPGAELSLSTAPLSWKAEAGGAAHLATCACALEDAARGLRALHERTGVAVRLALEPEPGCTLETTPELAAFFEGPLGDLRAREDGSASFLGACYDVCHQAVQWEDAVEALEMLSAAGVPVFKVQASCALELPEACDAAGRAAIARFDEPVYLHQVGARDAAGVVHRARDLGEALADPGGAWRALSPWRSHFHVPVFREAATPPLRTTQRELEGALRHVARRAVTAHVEIETYTWDALPAAERRAGSGFDLVEALAREYEWVLGTLAAEGTRPAKENA
jgi:sugar phosphate isomerase/epimerase